VSTAAAPRLGAYAGVSALSLLAALVLGRPELAALAAPFAVLLAVGLPLAHEPRLTVRTQLDRDRALEGDSVTLTVGVEAERAVERLELLLPLPSTLATEAADNPRIVRLDAGDERTFEIPVHCARWGAYLPGHVVVRARDRFGLFVYEGAFDRRSPLKVYPPPEHLRELLKPLETQVFAGNQVARLKADGIEFADLRPFVPGDRVRRINWRASARQRLLIVNEHHPERNSDVVLFLDSFAEARGTHLGTLDLAVRAAAALATRYLSQKDRVGLVTFGGTLNWLLPATGLVQMYRIVDALLDTEIVLNYVWKDIDVIPVRTLPPKALVLALSPLLDERALAALLDLRARGFDVVVIDVSPVPFAAPGRREAAALAHRLWLHRRAAMRARFEGAGVPVAEWREGEPLAQPLEEVSRYRRHARLVRA
jgi:uncharacterized protein (DUF58 family)